MRAVPVIAAVLVLAQLAGTVAFLLSGMWLLAGVLSIGAVALLVVWVRLRMLARKPDPITGYVERERIGF